MRNSPFYRAEHEAFRATVSRFVAREVAPHVDDWDEAGGFPRELYARAAKSGSSASGYPPEYGGFEADRFMRLVATQEFARCGSGGVAASLFSHTIGAPPILKRGSAELKARVLPRILSGEKISDWRSRNRAAARMSPTCRPARDATATRSSSTARKTSSPRACAPII